MINQDVTLEVEMIVLSISKNTQVKTMVEDQTEMHEKGWALILKMNTKSQE